MFFVRKAKQTLKIPFLLGEGAFSGERLIRREALSGGRLSRREAFSGERLSRKDMRKSRAVPSSRVNQYPMTQEHYLLKFQSFVLLFITSNCKNFQSYRCYSYFSFEKYVCERMIYYRLWLIVLHPNWFPVFALFGDF